MIKKMFLINSINQIIKLNKIKNIYKSKPRNKKKNKSNNKILKN